MVRRTRVLLKKGLEFFGVQDLLVDLLSPGFPYCSSSNSCEHILATIPETFDCVHLECVYRAVGALLSGKLIKLITSSVEYGDGGSAGASTMNTGIA